MTRIEITIGLLATMITVAILAMYGTVEEDRMVTSARSFNVRSVERGAEMFDTLCSECHGPNAIGNICPPLNEDSGLHGGAIGPGVAWRLEDLGWERSDAYGYIYQTIEAGRTVSTRPWRWVGARPPEGGGMAMPAWGQKYAGPLRPDQILDITNYLVNFKTKLPDSLDDAVAYAATVPETVLLSDAPSADPKPDGSDPVVLGAWLFKNQACVTCHTMEGVSAAVVGPVLTNVATSALERIASAEYTGSATTAAEYIHESIVTPALFVVPDYVGKTQMLATFGSLPAEDLDALVAYLLAGGKVTTAGAGATDAAGVADGDDAAAADGTPGSDGTAVGTGTASATGAAGTAAPEPTSGATPTP